MPRIADTYPQIVKFREKHGSQYFIANSLEDRLQAFYKIFKERFDLGYYYPTVADIEKEHEKYVSRLKEGLPEVATAFTREEMEERGLTETIEVLNEYDRKMERINRNYALEKSFVEALNHLGTLTPTEAIAYTRTNERGRTRRVLTEVIDSRNDHQYEEYEIIIPSTFTPN